MITEQIWHGETVHILENDKLSITLCPAINNNLIRIWDKTLEREVLRVPDDPAALRANPAHFGTPILMPPNRIIGGAFTFDGRPYQFLINRPNNMHNHGVLQALPWKVKQVHEDQEVISITSTFRTFDHPVVMEQFPHDFELEVTYELVGSTLNHKVKATNYSELKAPFGYGLHTWFLLDHKPQDWKFTLPVSGIWELGSDLMPTGQILPLGELQGLPEGISLKGTDFDTVFHIGNEEYPHVATLEDDRCIIRYSAPSDKFKHWVIYTKGEADNFICAEPYTWVTNAPNVPRDAELTGIIGIPSGESIELDILLDISYK
ncbi:aldose 1-epimerase [Paenibacillus albiflavus]|uniref:Aldose 1-epimerase n=1 Tax=Paenibacillus albiflavus TaxID=2545760 RepID=A0A4R4ED22_9BACL|nr:aldose 1-epimerase [Paenibacillus albiflavus]TCZ75865.1 aldose 1-epimerase [Paenibacillus albiflavus]